MERQVLTIRNRGGVIGSGCEDTMSLIMSRWFTTTGELWTVENVLSVRLLNAEWIGDRDGMKRCGLSTKQDTIS